MRALAKISTPPTPSKSNTSLGSARGSRTYAKWTRHVGYSAYPSTMTSSSSNVLAKSNARSDSTHRFKSYGCSLPKNVGNGRHTLGTITS